MKKIMIIFLFCLSIGDVYAQEKQKTAVELLEALRSKTMLRVQFTESVKLPFLRKALISKGQLVISPIGNFIREMKYPKTSITVLTGETITMQDSSGSITIDKTTAPEIISVITLLQSLVSADLESLEKNYLITTEIEGDSWSLTLKSRLRKSIFQKCTVSGKGKTVNGIHLLESDGVERKMEFGTLQKNAKLSPSEFKFLNPK